jgi:XTP/dITP diphosphohydrolase
MLILFATSNPHKIDEVRDILAPLGITVIGLDSLDEIPPEPVEDGKTFEDNARIKAVAYANATGRITLADDSGLEVDALGGKPGIHSARYARDDHGKAFDSLPRDERDQLNNAKLLDAIKAVPESERTARFVCAMTLAAPNGIVLAETRGTFEGIITDTPRGTNGFGYDPLLYLPDEDRTSAELSAEEKNARSHRGDAARKMAQLIREQAAVQRST